MGKVEDGGFEDEVHDEDGPEHDTRYGNQVTIHYHVRDDSS